MLADVMVATEARRLTASNVSVVVKESTLAIIQHLKQR
jgi:hypothetical protein